MEISQLNDLVNFLEKFVAFSRIIVLSCLIKRGDYGLYIYILLDHHNNLSMDSSDKNDCDR